MADTFDVLFKTTADLSGAQQAGAEIQRVSGAVDASGRSFTKTGAAARGAQDALRQGVSAMRDLGDVAGGTAAILDGKLLGGITKATDGLGNLIVNMNSLGKGGAAMLAVQGLASGGQAIMQTMEQLSKIADDREQLGKAISDEEVTAARAATERRIEERKAAEAAAEYERSLAQSRQTMSGLAVAAREMRAALKDAAAQEEAVAQERDAGERAQIERALASGAISEGQAKQSKRLLEDRQAAEALARKLAAIDTQQAAIADERAQSEERLQKAKQSGDKGAIDAAGAANQEIAGRTGPERDRLAREAQAAVAVEQQAMKRRSSERAAEDAQQLRAAEETASANLASIGPGGKGIAAGGGIGAAAVEAGRALSQISGKSPEATARIDQLASSLTDGTSAQELAKLGPAIEKALAAARKSQAEQVKEVKQLIAKLEALAGQNNLQ